MTQQLIDTKKNFPENVFSGEWSAYLFFDSDWIFSPEFIEFCNVFLKRDASRAVEIVDLDEPESTYKINAGTTWQDYRGFLNGRSFDGWLYDVHRFIAFSADQSWCMYIERNAEVAVFAFKATCDSEIQSFVIERFKALPVEKAVETENTAVFHRKLAQESFTRELVQSYALTSHDSPPQVRDQSP